MKAARRSIPWLAGFHGYLVANERLRATPEPPDSDRTTIGAKYPAFRCGWHSGALHAEGGGGSCVHPDCWVSER